MTTTTSTPALLTQESAPVRDLATIRGYYTTVRTTIGKYLGDLGLYHPSTRTVRWDASIVHVDFQRAAIGIKKNSVKRTMLRDVMRGGTVPPVCLAEVSEQARNLIIDGLQRTHVEATGLKSLIAKENGDDVEPFIQEELQKIIALDQSPLSVDQFLARPFEYQLWRDLTPDEIVRLFILLNAGQQKVTPRHLLEVMGAQLRQMFSSWGLSNMTDRERREQQGRRGPDRQVEGVNVYRYEYVLDGLIAYLSRDPHVKTSQVLQGLASDGKLSVRDTSIEERITDIGAAECRSDLVWVFRDINEAMAAKYEEAIRSGSTRSCLLTRSRSRCSPHLALLATCQPRAQPSRTGRPS